MKRFRDMEPRERSLATRPGALVSVPGWARVGNNTRGVIDDVNGEYVLVKIDGHLTEVYRNELTYFHGWADLSQPDLFKDTQ